MSSSSSSSSAAGGAVKRSRDDITPDVTRVSEHFQNNYSDAVKRANKRCKTVAVTEINKKSIVAWEACAMKRVGRVGNWLPEVLRMEILQYMPLEFEHLPSFPITMAQQNTKIAEDRDFKLIKKKMMEFIEQRSVDGFDHAIVMPRDIENWADEVSYLSM